MTNHGLLAYIEHLWSKSVQLEIYTGTLYPLMLTTTLQQIYVLVTTRPLCSIAFTAQAQGLSSKYSNTAQRACSNWCIATFARAFSRRG